MDFKWATGSASYSYPENDYGYNILLVRAQGFDPKVVSTINFSEQELGCYGGPDYAVVTVEDENTTRYVCYKVTLLQPMCSNKGCGLISVQRHTQLRENFLDAWLQRCSPLLIWGRSVMYTSLNVKYPMLVPSLVLYDVIMKILSTVVLSWAVFWEVF